MHGYMEKVYKDASNKMEKSRCMDTWKKSIYMHLLKWKKSKILQKNVKRLDACTNGKCLDASNKIEKV